ncbi:MAG: VOC family protein [Sneathiellaceae bacterium]
MADELALQLDHLTLNVGDLARARRFYAAVLAPLGLEVVGERPAEGPGDAALVGFGIGRKGNLWLAARGRQEPAGHFAFRAASRQAVRAFHAAALAHGGSDNGPPGIRHAYHPAYYAAFVIDPEGHNVEAVCFDPE